MLDNISRLTDIEDINVLDTIELVLYDHNLPALQDRIKQSKRDFYRSNEKIVILHIDTDYHYQNHPLGFVLHNLFVIWRSLDIPYSAMVLVHNHYGLTQGLEYFLVNELDRPITVHTLVNHESMIHLRGTRITDPELIQYPAVCLLGYQRAHRVKLMQYLVQENLLEKVRTNFGAKDTNHKLPNGAPALLDPSPLLHTVSSSPHRSNEDFFNSSRHAQIVQLASVPVDTWRDPVLVGEIDDFYGKFAVDIVTETMFHSPNVFVSEKTLRPLLLKLPFVMFGAQHTLRLLQAYGFRTFGEFWDESYDNIADPHQRFLACCCIIKEICSISLDDLRAIRRSMVPLLDHNRQTLLNYIEQQVKPMYKLIDLHDKFKKFNS